MNRLALHYRLLFTFVVLVIILVPGVTFAQDSIPGIPHAVEGLDACLACHGTGIAGATKIPDDHAGRTNDMCRTCHQPVAPGAQGTAAPSPTSGPTVAAGEPVPIPHPLQGRDACLACHETGIAGATKIPQNHTGRTNDMCRTCHQPVAPAAAATAVPTATTGPTAAAKEPVPIPHPLEGRDACLACHETGIAGATKIPEDHSGRTNDMCRTCHQPAVPVAAETPTPSPTSEPTAATGEPVPMPHPLEGWEDCLECHAGPGMAATPTGGAPSIPHPLVGRDNCLACHEKGIGGAPQIPADHAGRTNDVCQACHQQAVLPPTPTPAAEVPPVPTPLVYPQAEGVDTCVECHAAQGGAQAEITTEWEHSIHAKRDVSCADCHGGNPAGKTVDEAMSPDAGYIGVPDKAAIPALCASCHSDVTLMRPYNLPTDQYAKYQQSIHGIRLAEGDTNVATCYDCHGGHEILEPNDPGATVYPTNVPQMCADCHSDVQLMAPYGIPTNQYDLYEQSIHGKALLEHQDLRAPSCATCHGTHGAAPPGFDEVASVCGGCHSATQNYYLQSTHSQLGDAGPECVTCHKWHDVAIPTEAMFLGTEPTHCGSCHPSDSEGGETAQMIHTDITGASEAYDAAEASVQAAEDLGMVVATEKNLLQDAKTDLFTSRAVQHTTSSERVAELTSSAQSTSEQVKASADAAVEESFFRRKAMIIAVIAIALVVGALYLLKRELHKQLDTEP